MSIFFKTKSFIFNFLFPSRCIICDNKKYIFNKKELCYACELGLIKQKDFVKKDLPEWINFKYSYKDKNIKKIEYNIKYFHNTKLANDIGKYCYNFLFSYILEKFDNLDQDYILVPVPISEKRMKERGYNQALEISKGINGKNIFEIIKRNKNTKKLFGLTESERNDILENAFTINEKEIERFFKKYCNKYNSVSEINVIIIDDITTTGSTFYNIKKVLIDYGFEPNKIYAFALAH